MDNILKRRRNKTYKKTYKLHGDSVGAEGFPLQPRGPIGPRQTNIVVQNWFIKNMYSAYQN